MAHKASTPRSIPLTRRVREILTRRKERYPAQPWTYTLWQVDPIWKWLRKEIGLAADKSCRIYCAWHTCATRMVGGAAGVGGAGREIDSGAKLGLLLQAVREEHMKPTFPPVLRMADFETIKLERDLDGGRLEVTGTLPTGLTVRATFSPSPEPKETWETIDWQISSE